MGLQNRPFLFPNSRKGPGIKVEVVDDFSLNVGG